MSQSVLTFPSALEVVLTREFDAPMELLFEVLWKPEHLRQTIAPFGETVTSCQIDLRVGGEWSYVFVTDDGYECSFRGTFLEVEAPRKTVQTWAFGGWEGVEATETMELRETAGGTTLSWTLAFADQAGRDRMTLYDGPESNFEILAAYLKTLG